MTLTWNEAGGSQRMATAAIVAAILCIATILGAYFFEFVLRYAPCPLCLTQRIPYYVVIPVSIVVAIAAYAGVSRKLVAAGLVVIAIAMVIGVGLGIYHSGVEWKWWAGPSDCSGPISNFGAAGGLLRTIETTPVVRCDEAAWRLLGLSLAGYNTLISAAVAGIALWGVAAVKRGEGS
jgi:disulfide bond formation protein DsbB